MNLRVFIRFYVTALSSNPDLQVLFNEKTSKPVKEQF